MLLVRKVLFSGMIVSFGLGVVGFHIVLVFVRWVFGVFCVFLESWMSFLFCLVFVEFCYNNIKLKNIELLDRGGYIFEVICGRFLCVVWGF